MRYFIKVFLVCAFFLSAIRVFAAGEDIKKITKIDVKGNMSINKNIILTQVKSKEGDLFIRDVINEDLRRIYGLGYFSDISIDVEDFIDGVAVYFVVTEKFSIASIAVKGNKIYKEKTILKELDVKPGEVFNKRTVQESIKKIKELYKKKGYYNADIDLQVKTKMETRQVDLVIDIIEQKRVCVKRVNFEGNSSLKSGVLKKKLKTKEKWMFGAGFFNDENLEEDAEKIANYYRSQGFMNVNVLEPVISYGKRNMFVTITYPIEEGPRFRTGIIEIKGNELFPLSEIKQGVLMREGHIFDQNKMIEDQKNIQTYYAERGYIFAAVKPSTYINTDTNIIDVTFSITENDLAYIEKIIVQGNTRTKDKVIRREIKLHPLEPFDGTKLKRSRENL
ncbi:outer membrane protein assembly factor BamA, partial [bacterium]|nr:outer membrane protein assembly factor BamA [bacterium]